MPNGLLLIDKPVGMRSAECVARVKRALGKDTRVGHAGTLDSTASGLLILLLGKATRLSDYVMKLPKVYEAEVSLGAATDTGDASGQVVFRDDAAKADESAFDRVLCSFWGERMQVPPKISALKQGGKPLHRIVRAGGDPRPASRPVCMTSVRRVSALSGGRVLISVTCGKGTYIRALARDIGTKLGCGAHVAALRRLSTGPFHVADAQDPDAADFCPLSRLRSLREAGVPFHRIRVTKDAETRLLNGLSVPLADCGRYIPGTTPLAEGLCVEGENMTGFGHIVEGRVLCLKPAVNIEGA